jgi:hypothetical protein
MAIYTILLQTTVGRALRAVLLIRIADAIVRDDLCVLNWWLIGPVQCVFC